MPRHKLQLYRTEPPAPSSCCTALGMKDKLDHSCQRLVYDESGLALRSHSFPCPLKEQTSIGTGSKGSGVTTMPGSLKNSFLKGCPSCSNEWELPPGVWKVMNFAGIWAGFLKRHLSHEGNKEGTHGLLKSDEEMSGEKVLSFTS